jgi:hypothetical protein
MNWTIANKRDPKAKDPKWYLIDLPKLLSTGKCKSPDGPCEKYHIQHEEAITNVVTAW